MKDKIQKNEKFFGSNFLMKNKRGWIRIVEVFVAILFLAGVVLVVINQDLVERTDISSQVHEIELSVLREIQLDSDLRNDIINTAPLPANWNDSQFPSSIKNKFNNRIPSYLSCTSRICAPSDECLLTVPEEINIYANSIIITVNTDQEIGTYDPRKLKLFCWVK